MLICVSVILGATVFREDIAQAAQLVSAEIVGPLDSEGNVKVHEQGTPTVKLHHEGNVVRLPTSRSSPIDVQEVDPPTKTPFQVTDDDGFVTYAVPAGRDAVVDYASSFCSGGVLAAIKISTEVGGVLVSHFLPAVLPATTGMAGGRVAVYADPGTTITATAVGSCGSVSLSGHLEE
jgi:hypothetical protein